MERLMTLGIIAVLALVVAFATPALVESFQEKDVKTATSILANATYVLDPTTGRLVRAQTPPKSNQVFSSRAQPSGPDAIFLALVEHLANQFVDHVKFMYPNDERGIPLVKQWQRDVQSARNVKISYDKSRGRLSVNPQHPDIQRPDRLRSWILHELARSTGKDRDDAWRQTWHWFLRIATTDLKWKCGVRPSDCKTYGLCHSEQCPRCDWQV